jgi:hypothetical protein
MAETQDWRSEVSGNSPLGLQPDRARASAWQQAARGCQANHFVSQQPRRPEGYVSVVPNGPLSFCERFYYDLYTVDDNNVLQKELLNRLRDRDQFQGAMHELFVEATCLRAGFSIVREEHQGLKPKNVELIALHGATQQHVSVEAKSRHRSGVMGRPGSPEAAPDTRFGRLINDSTAKDPHNPLAIFVDTNLPPSRPSHSTHQFRAIR